MNYRIFGQAIIHNGHGPDCTCSTPCLEDLGEIPKNVTIDIFDVNDAYEAVKEAERDIHNFIRWHRRPIARLYLDGERPPLRHEDELELLERWQRGLGLPG